MSEKIIVDVDERQTRVAMLEEGRLAEVLYEQEEEERVVGNIYLGRVSDVVPGLDAAFVDCGIEKNAFLHVSDAIQPEPPNRFTRTPPISSILSAGQEIMVQVTKGPLASKGARATRHISLPGRHLVLMPESSTKVGVSKKIEDEVEQKRLRTMASRVRPEGFGVIVRTQAEGADYKELEDDVKFLMKLWNSIQNKAQQSKAPALLHEDLSLVFEVVRDTFSEEVEALIVNDKVTYDRILNLLDSVVPELRSRVELYRSHEPIFDHYGVEQEISKALHRKVWLPHGGYIAIDPTEALTAIDVNTGKFTGTGSLEETVLRTNVEAAEEIGRQLRLRGIGGIIVIDFIDMDKAKHRKQVSSVLHEAFAKDRKRTRIQHITRLGLVEMTRKRTESNLAQKLQSPCPYCSGSGKVLSAETVAMRAIRQLRISNIKEGAAVVVADPMVCLALVGPHGTEAEKLGDEFSFELFIRATRDIHPEEFEIVPTSRQQVRHHEVDDHLTINNDDVLAVPHAGLLAIVDGYLVEVPEASAETQMPLMIRLTKASNSYGRGTPV